MIKRLSLIASLLGIFILISFLFLQNPKEILEPEFSSFLPNQEIIITGNVIKEDFYQNNKILYLNNNFQLICAHPCPNLINKNITVIANLEHFNDKYYLKILKLIENN